MVSLFTPFGPHMKRTLLFLIFSIVLTMPIRGQNRIYNQEFQLSIDNDAFLYPSHDRYYSNGISLERRSVINQEHKVYKYFSRKFSGLQNIIWGLSIGHNFYTSRRIQQKDVAKFDRPYAGWLYGATYLNLLLNEKSVLKTYLDVGVVGPVSGGEVIQKWWHRTVGVAGPKGWEYQINNTPAINIKILYQRQVLDLSFLDLISESTIQVGTIRNNIRQGAVLRIINMRPLSNSIYTQSKLGNGIGRSFTGFKLADIQEIFLFGGTEVEYVFYNSLIEGNFIGKESPHVEIASPWVIHWKYGIALGGYFTDFNLTLNHLTAETTKSTHHSYVGMDFTFRF